MRNCKNIGGGQFYFNTTKRKKQAKNLKLTPF